MIKTIAKGLEDKLNDVVFVGGSLLELYVDDPAISEPRATYDVDIIIKIATRARYDVFEAELRKKGFINDIDGPSCRMIYQSIKVDIIATEQSIAGFTNRWYIDGFEKSTPLLIDDTKINIFPVEYFITSKFEAFKDRGKNNLILSQDFEDIVYIFDGKDSVLQDVISSEQNVKNYLKNELKLLLENPSLKEALAAHLGYGSDQTRADRIIKIFENIINS